MKKYLPSFVSGFGAGVLQVVPVVKMLSCCFIVPIASLASIVLHKKSNNLRIDEIKMSDAVKLGIMTGLVAALFATGFEILITLISKSNDFTKASIAFASVFASFPVYLFILPIIMINGLEMKAWDAGLALGLAAVATLLISPIAGNLSDRAGPEKLCMSGALMSGIG